MIRISTKISRENAVKELERIMEIAEMAEFQEEFARPYINKIMFGKLFAKDGSIHYELSRPLDIGQGPKKAFALLAPDSKSFKDNDIKLSDFSENGTGEASEETMLKCVSVFLGIPSEIAEKEISLKDKVAIFQIGTMFFLSV